MPEITIVFISILLSINSYFECLEYLKKASTKTLYYVPAIAAGVCLLNVQCGFSSRQKDTM